MFELDALKLFHFLRPEWLLLIVPFILLAYIQLHKQEMLSQWKPFIASHLLPHMIVQGSNRRIFSPLWVMPLIAILICIALAGPSWQRQPSPFAEDNATLLIALDLTPSMEQKDIQPSRMQRAKTKILGLLEKRGDAYTSLVVYAGTAHTLIPLSNDRDVITHFLDSVNANMMPRQGKAPESVLPLADRLLKNAKGPATLLFITDGVTENSAVGFKQFFARTEHQLLVWGIGSTQEQLDNISSGTYQSNVTPLQEEPLSALADIAGGYYQPLTVDDEDIEVMYKKINSHFLLADDDNRPWVDSGYLFLLPIMLLFLQWFRKGWTLQW